MRNNPEFRKCVKEYNENVSEWNERFGQKAKAIPVDINKFQDSYSGLIKKTVMSNEMTERRKITATITILGDFSGIRGSTDSKELTRSELANVTVKSGERVLNHL